METNSVEHPDASDDAQQTSICSYMPLELSRKFIDPDGDLSLKVGETKCVYKTPRSGTGDQDLDHEHELPVIYIVCSKALSRASRVWKCLLYGGYLESKPSCASSASDWVVELPDDNPKAMAIILSIVHSRFDALPRTTDIISLEYLYQLTVLTDKYDLTTLLRPWAPIWMNSAREKYKSCQNPVTSDLERLLWIAWEMGDINLFRMVWKDLAIHCPVDDKGDFQNNTGNEVVPLFSSTLEPPGQAAMKAARLNVIKNVLAIYRYTIAKLLKKWDDPERKHTCQHEKPSQRCEASVLGDIILTLAWSGYWPLPKAADVRTSIKSLSAVLKNIRTASTHHSDCDGIKKKDLRIDYCLNQFPWYIPPAVKARMKRQSAKSGIIFPSR